jgi:anti-sigma factor RsiW
MNCGRVCNQLSAYIDRELTGAEMMQMRHHLGDCEACGAEYEALCRMKMLMGRLPTSDPRTDFVAATLRRREGQTASVLVFSSRPPVLGPLLDRWRLWLASQSWQPALFRWHWQMPLGVSAVALAGALILTSVFLHRPRHSDALVATSPISVLEGQDPLSHAMNWEWRSLEASGEYANGSHIYGAQLPLNWVSASYPSGAYRSFR